MKEGDHSTGKGKDGSYRVLFTLITWTRMVHMRASTMARHSHLFSEAVKQDDSDVSATFAL